MIEMDLDTEMAWGNNKKTTMVSALPPFKTEIENDVVQLISKSSLAPISRTNLLEVEVNSDVYSDKAIITYKKRSLDRSGIPKLKRKADVCGIESDASQEIDMRLGKKKKHDDRQLTWVNNQVTESMKEDTGSQEVQNCILKGQAECAMHLHRDQ